MSLSYSKPGAPGAGRCPVPVKDPQCPSPSLNLKENNSGCPVFMTALVSLEPLYCRQRPLNILSMIDQLPGKSIWFDQAFPMIIAFRCCCSSINVFSTFSITYCLLSMRKLVRQSLPMRDVKIYTSLAAMIIESAALPTVL